MGKQIMGKQIIQVKLNDEDQKKFKTVKDSLNISGNADTIRVLIREKYDSISKKVNE